MKPYRPQCGGFIQPRTFEQFVLRGIMSIRVSFRICYGSQGSSLMVNLKNENLQRKENIL